MSFGVEVMGWIANVDSKPSHNRIMAVNHGPCVPFWARRAFDVQLDLIRIREEQPRQHGRRGLLTCSGLTMPVSWTVNVNLRKIRFQVDISDDKACGISFAFISDRRRRASLFCWNAVHATYTLVR